MRLFPISFFRRKKNWKIFGVKGNRKRLMMRIILKRKGLIEIVDYGFRKILYVLHKIVVKNTLLKWH
jgi:mRNA-degrading endonuclease HigB of HigAB toxin-antitoxin module